MQTTQITPKTFTCKISDSWMRSLESAYITITTPKGTHLTIDKWEKANQKNKWTKNPEAAALVWKVYAQAQTGTIELTKEEVMLWKEHSNEQDRDLTKRFQPKAKATMVKGNIKAGKCGCGGTLKLNDHGTWVGYYCPKCTSGGSYNK